MKIPADTLMAAQAAVTHFEYLLDCGALDDRKDAEHIKGLRALLEAIRS